MISVLIRAVILIQIVLLIGFVGCKTDKKAENNLPDNLFKGKVSKIKYAKLFDLYESGDLTKVVIHSPFNKKDSAVYYLVDSSKYDKYLRYANVIKVPVNRAGVLSVTQLDGLQKMGLLDRVKGISDEKYIKDSTVREYLKSGKIVEISSGNDFYAEKAVFLNLDAVFFSPFKDGQNLFVSDSVKVLPFFDFMEENPLGRSEWIKFTAVFFGCKNASDSIFVSIEEKYNRLTGLVKNVKKHPSVFSGKYFNGQWYVPGGKSYIAKIFEDAGADYVFKNDKSGGSLALDFEVVFKKAKNADYWRILGGLNTLGNVYDNLKNDNELYSKFNAFEKHHIIYCDPGKTRYFEKGTLEPDVILSDFIYVFHKQILPDYKPVYYKLLK